MGAHGSEVGGVVELPFAGDEVFVVRRDAAFVFDVGVGGVGDHLGHRFLDGDAHHVKVADVEVDTDSRRLDLGNQANRLLGRFGGVAHVVFQGDGDAPRFGIASEMVEPVHQLRLLRRQIARLAADATDDDRGMTVLCPLGGEVDGRFDLRQVVGVAVGILFHHGDVVIHSRKGQVVAV